MKVDIKCIISAPVSTYSGYGARSRDFIKQLIEQRPNWDIKIIPQRWGNTREGYLKDHKETELLERLISKIDSKPDIFIQHTVPNEFRNIGTYNIGLTAGIETTLCDPSWIEGINRMDLVIVSSNHSKDVFKQSSFKIPKTGETLEVKTPIEVLFEGVDLSQFKPCNNPLSILDDIKESYLFLNVGTWMNGKLGEDRKNIGLTVKSFLETFKNKREKPGLLLKTHLANTSTVDKAFITEKINQIKQTVKGDLPSVYLLHGDLKEEEVNKLYNHPKIKTLVSHTKGEGFGRPLLEFAAVGKPIICSNWSGPLDFLDSRFTKFINGTLTKVDTSAQVKNIILKESSWFTPNQNEVGKAYKELYKNYKQYKTYAKRQKHIVHTTYNVTDMGRHIHNIILKYVPDFPEKVELKLPKIT